MKHVEKRYLTLMLLAILTSTYAFAETQLSARSISTKDGLPSNFVQDMVQDNFGFIWFGTSSGLSRYDGYSFLNFQTIGTGGAKAYANIGTIHIDGKNELLWMRSATFNYACYDLKRGTFVNYTGDCDAQKTYQKYVTEPDGIWFYEATSGVRHVTYHNGLFKCKDYYQEDGTLPKSRIKRIMPDQQGGVWAVTNNGLYRINKEGALQVVVDKGDFMMGNHWQNKNMFLERNGHLLVFDQEGKKLFEGNIPAALGSVTKVNGNIIWRDKWVVMSRDAVFTFDCNDYTIARPQELQMTYGLPLNDVDGNHWVSDEMLNLWLLPKDGSVRKFKLLNDTWTDVQHRRRFTVTQGDDGKFYIATYGNGLFIYDAKTDQMEHHSAKDAHPLFLTNYLNDIMKDRDGGIWVSQGELGVVCLNQKPQPMTQLIFPEPDQQGEMTNYINRLHLDSDGAVIIGTRGNKTYRLTAQTNSIRYAGINTISASQTDSLQDKQGRIWIATWEEGLQLRQGTRQQQLLTRSTTESRVNALALDRAGRLWIGTFNGLYMLDTHKKEFTNEDFLHFGTPDGLPSNNISCLLTSNDGVLWVGLREAGIVRCETSEKGILATEVISTRQGLLSNNIHSLIEDKLGRVWAGTEDAVSVIFPKDNLVENFQIGNSALSRIYSDNCALALSDGHLAFGTRNGLLLVSPESVNEPQVKLVKAFLTDISINGKSQEWSVYDTSDLSFASTENSLTLHFSSFDFRNPEQTQYQFYLEGLERDWREPSTLYIADYGNLRPGHYKFHLRTGENGEETTYNITIRQPWYNTWLAWLAYLILISIAGWYIYRNWHEKFQLRQQMMIEKQVTEFRLDFFTHITHEFRTPLAIISGGVEKLSNGETSKGVLQNVQRGTRRLTRLINQLMEFRKLNTHNMRLSVEQADIIGFVRDVYQDFWSVAQQKEQELSLSTAEKRKEILFDKHIVETVVYNLLSNAVKYTPEHGTIAVSLRQNEGRFVISVKDSGPGISPEREREMFKPFMHGLASQGGMGIGLYTAHQMAELHHGSLTYERQTDGSCFTFMLPIDETCYSADELKSLTAIASSEPNRQNDMPVMEMLPEAMNDYRVVIIEDDPDMMQQIRAEVSIYFQTECYGNGLSAIEHITADPPSLILCDVMLPDINGYEIVSRLRNDEATRSVPIIMLTALDDEQHQIKGYAAGADDYMVKPCNYRLLIARAASLIKWSSQIPAAIPQNTDPAPQQMSPNASIITSQMDKRLRDRIEQLVANHISDPDFSTDQMADALKMGRTKFYGKVKEIMGVPPNKYIINERMRLAEELLRESDLNISEISYKVGIPDLSYFNRCFKAHFGMAPSKYRKEL